jgi:hypothetical protein
MFFLDSYAILEMARGNPAYRPFVHEPVITMRANLLEVYYVLAQSGETALADASLKLLGPHSVDLPVELIARVAAFRMRKKGATGRRFSYADASGYVYARENGYEFLTGAEEFEGLPSVRYVR